MYLKPELPTEINRDDDGFLTIIQKKGRVVLSANQVMEIHKWLEKGNGIHLEADWNNGVAQGNE